MFSKRINLGYEGLKKEHIMIHRKVNYDIMDEIVQRWSPRAFSTEPVKEEELMAMLEAARFAPSCFNEQPWRFIVGYSKETREKVLSVLGEANQVWAKKAPVLMIIVAKKTFEMTGKDNFWHMFDAGTAWGYFSLEAQRRGFITHGMGGFNKKKTVEIFELGEEYQPIAAVAIGMYGDKDALPEDLREREVPAERKELEELILVK